MQVCVCIRIHIRTYISPAYIRCFISMRSQKCLSTEPPFTPALALFLSHSFSLIVSCLLGVSVSVVSCVCVCVSLSVFTFYIKYCVPDDFTKLYPGIMYFTLCEATDCEKMSRIHFLSFFLFLFLFIFFFSRRYLFSCHTTCARYRLVVTLFDDRSTSVL